MTIFGSQVSVLCLVFVFFIFGKYKGPGRHPIVFAVKFHVECIQNHVCGPLVARDMSIFLVSKYQVNLKINLCKCRRKHKCALVAVVTAAARAGAWSDGHRHSHHCHHRTPVFASTFVEVYLKAYRII